MKKILYFILIIGIFYLPNISLAEGDITILDSDININTWPENPQPYENVTITVSSYATDLNKAIIEWSNNSKKVLSGYGKTSYSFQTLGPDTTSSFTVTITPEGSIDKIIKRINIVSSEVEIMYESVGEYTPPFYKGKSLITRGSYIKAVAMPNTKTITSGKGKISYKWKLNDNSVQNSSGYDKDAYIFKNSDLHKTEDVTVTASSVNGDYNATQTITIPTFDPKILFYKKSPTEGIMYNKYLDNNFLLDANSDEMTIVAEPYFMVLGNTNTNFNWKINDNIIETPGDKNELTIRPTSRGGYADISLTIENLDELFQKVTGQFKLNL